MRILDRALSRVRRGVKDVTVASPDGTLAHTLSWLESELRSDAVPQRLRDAAGRLASLLGSHDPRAGADVDRSTRARAPAVVALEDALAAKVAQSASELPPQVPTDSAHARDLSGGVCPFTGLRADGTLAVPAATAAPAPVIATTTATEPELQVPVRAKPGRKNKERLAGTQVVEKTSARSATRSARKQPRSRAQASRKKA